MSDSLGPDCEEDLLNSFILSLIRSFNPGVSKIENTRIMNLDLMVNRSKHQRNEQQQR